MEISQKLKYFILISLCNVSLTRADEHFEFATIFDSTFFTDVFSGDWGLY